MAILDTEDSHCKMYDTYKKFHFVWHYVPPRSWLYLRTVLWTHFIALITKNMSTLDSAIDRKSFYEPEKMFYCLLPKKYMQMKDLHQHDSICHFQHKSNILK